MKACLLFYVQKRDSEHAESKGRNDWIKSVQKNKMRLNRKAKEKDFPLK